MFPVVYLVAPCLLISAIQTLPTVLRPVHLDQKRNLLPESEFSLKSNNSDDEQTRYIFAYKWCMSYHYCAQQEEKPENMTLEKIKETIYVPIKRIKRLYRLESKNCNLTTELLNILSQPRCIGEDEKSCLNGNCSGRKKRWTRLGSDKWKKMPVTYKFKNYLTSSSLSVADQESSAQICARLWSESSGLSMQFLKKASTANIEIEFVSIDGPKGIVGRGVSPNLFGSSIQQLDSSESWKKNSNDPKQGIPLQWALCHEIGHNLGLGHSDDMNAIMFPSFVGQDDSMLAVDDLNGIQALYGKSQNQMSTTPKPRQKNRRQKNLNKKLKRRKKLQ